jgi:hypothetical protein
VKKPATLITPFSTDVATCSVAMDRFITLPQNPSSHLVSDLYSKKLLS